MTRNKPALARHQMWFWTIQSRHPRLQWAKQKSNLRLGDSTHHQHGPGNSSKCELLYGRIEDVMRRPTPPPRAKATVNNVSTGPIKKSSTNGGKHVPIPPTSEEVVQRNLRDALALLREKPLRLRAAAAAQEQTEQICRASGSVSMIVVLTLGRSKGLRIVTEQTRTAGSSDRRWRWPSQMSQLLLPFDIGNILLGSFLSGLCLFLSQAHLLLSH